MMREGLVECKECRFWIQGVEEDPKLGARLLDVGLCVQRKSINWLLNIHKYSSCRYGELKIKGIG